MQEIEVKASFGGSLQALQEKLLALGAKQEKELQQNDAIYLPKGMTFGDIRSGMPVLRVRNQNGQGVFTIKQKSYQNLLAAIELETKIDNVEEFARMLDLMNFSSVMEVKKHRLLFHYQDLEICADEVAELGVFIEVEKLLPEGQEIETVQNELWQFLDSLGVTSEQRVTVGYDNLLWKQRMKNGV